MKITNLNLYLVRPRWCFLEMETDEGITGWGEPVLEGHCDAVKACVEEMKPYLIGHDPSRIEDIWSTIYRAGFYRGGGVLMSAIAGIDQALWDIKGKFFNTPVYQSWTVPAATTCACTAGSAATAPATWALLLWSARMPALPPSR